MYKLYTHLNVTVPSCKSPWNTTTVASHMLQEHLHLTLFSAVNLAFFLAIWQLIEAWLASHFLQSVHCVCSRPKGCKWSECVDVHFERLLVVSGSLDSTVSRHHWIWVWIQKEEESTFLACFARFLLKLRDI